MNALYNDSIRSVLTKLNSMTRATVKSKNTEIANSMLKDLAEVDHQHPEYYDSDEYPVAKLLSGVSPEELAPAEHEHDDLLGIDDDAADTKAIGSIPARVISPLVHEHPELLQSSLVPSDATFINLGDEDSPVYASPRSLFARKIHVHDNYVLRGSSVAAAYSLFKKA